MERFKGRTTLTLMQSIRTVPVAFCSTMNTCGRICVHKNGRFVIVSNRGHESIAIFRVKSKGPLRGQLQIVGYFHTRGETPRHFQFDSSGQYLVVANQDTDSIAVFAFNLSSGEIKYTGHEYRVPSPNFVCCCPIRDTDPMSVPSSIQRISDLINADRINGDRVDSDLEESDSSTVAVNDAEVLRKKLADALRQVDDLRDQLQRMNSRS